MSKEQAYLISLKSFSWFYRRRMMKNIDNGLGINMLEEVAQRAERFYRWSNHYSSKWEQL